MIKRSSNRKGFTLTELMIAIFILTVILIMGAAFANYSTGRLVSAKNISATEAIRNTFDIVAQKMGAMNNKALGLSYGSPPPGPGQPGSQNVYGFRPYLADCPSVLPGPTTPNAILMVVSKDSAGSPKCTFFAHIGDSLKMYENSCSNYAVINYHQDCDSTKPLVHDDSASFVAVTPPNIKVTQFYLDSDVFKGILYSNDISTITSVPYVKVSISAEDLTNQENNIKLQNTYYMDYQTLKQLTN